MNRLNRILLPVFFALLSNACFTQQVEGFVRFADHGTAYTFTGISSGIDRTLCDSIGHFQIKLSSISDTLTISPFPKYIRVKIYHFPDSINNLKLDSIPLFIQPDMGIPIVHFKSKRASKKFFKNLAKEQDTLKQETMTAIRNSWISVNGKRVPMLLQQRSDTWLIFIDLGRECP